MGHVFMSEIQYLVGLAMSKFFFVIIPSYGTTGIIQLTVFTVKFKFPKHWTWHPLRQLVSYENIACDHIGLCTCQVD